MKHSAECECFTALVRVIAVQPGVSKELVDNAGDPSSVRTDPVQNERPSNLALWPRGNRPLVERRPSFHFAGDFGPRQAFSHDLPDGQIKEVAVGGSSRLLLWDAVWPFVDWIAARVGLVDYRVV